MFNWAETPEIPHFVTRIVDFVFMTGLFLSALALVYIHRRPPDSPDLSLRLKCRPWQMPEALVIIALMLASMVGFPSGLAEIAGLTIIILKMLQTGSTGSDAFGLNTAKIGRNILIGIILYITIVPLVFSYRLILDVFSERMCLQFAPQQAVERIADPGQPESYRMLMLAWAIVIAPIVEELFFRGVVLSALCKHARPSVAIFAASAVFGLMHQPFSVSIPIFVLGIGLSLAYLYTGSLLVPIIMHTFFNAGNISLILLQ